VYRLVSQRIQELCNAFADQISRERVEAVWRVVFHVLSSHRELMYDRHLDQVQIFKIFNIFSDYNVQYVRNLQGL
jgi:hypothetical protein